MNSPACPSLEIHSPAPITPSPEKIYKSLDKYSSPISKGDIDQKGRNEKDEAFLCYNNWKDNKSGPKIAVGLECVGIQRYNVSPKSPLKPTNVNFLRKVSPSSDKITDNESTSRVNTDSFQKENIVGCLNTYNPDHKSNGLSCLKKNLNRKSYCSDQGRKSMPLHAEKDWIVRSPAFDEECGSPENMKVINVNSTDEGTEVTLSMIDRTKQMNQPLQNNAKLKSFKNTSQSAYSLPTFNTASKDQKPKEALRKQDQEIYNFDFFGSLSFCGGMENFGLTLQNVKDTESKNMKKNEHRSARRLSESSATVIVDARISKSCCGNTRLDLKDKIESYNVSKIIEQTIASMLETEDSWCSGWHVWGLYLKDIAPPELQMNPKAIRRCFHNRAQNLKKKSLRIQRLHYNIAPFLSDDMNLRQAKKLKKSISLTDIKHEKKFDKFRSRVPHTSSLFTPKACIDAEPSNIDFHIDEEDLCYDSDPGTRRPHIKSLFLQRDSCSKQLNFSNIVEAPSIVQETLNRSMTLIWHPTPDDSGWFISPTRVPVTAWIERGHQLRSSLIQPKFVWRKKHSDSYNKKALKNVNEYMNKIDLLDITHILTPKTIDRNKHPFARARNCFLLEFFSKSILFEASCQSERDSIVHNLKVTVARLGSKIIANDDSCFEEFFHPRES